MFTERMVKKYLSFYFYDRESDAMYLKSTDLLVGHNKCLQKAELIEQIQKDHARDHRAAETIYESLRKEYYPVVRERL